MTIAIRVENISKCYVIEHQQRERFTTLRDSLASAARRIRSHFQGRSSNASASKEEFWALRDINFEVRQGDRVGIIGRNGAGKSTLLKILSHITEPSEGRITISGTVASLLEVGTGFHPELTGRENIFLNGAILGMPRTEIQAKFDEIVDFAGVEKFLDTPVKRYSSGMYVRLAFAVAAHLDPEILVIDEVLAVGDAQFQKKCLGKMEEAGNDGRTVLFVSHNLPTVLRLCPQSVLLDGGRLVANGETSRVIQTYMDAKMPGQDAHQDLRDAARTSGIGERFIFTHCTLLDADGMATNLLRFGEPFSIRVGFLATTDLDAVSFALGIDTSAEVRVATLVSEESNALTDFASGQEGEMSAMPRQLVLKPGRYFVTLGARHHGRPLDHLPLAMSFDVDPVPWRGEQPPSDTWGIVRVLADWSLTPRQHMNLANLEVVDG